MKSLFSLIFILSLFLQTGAMGQGVGASGRFEKDEIQDHQQSDFQGRTGGETIETAFEITSLPFYETGWTNNMTDDYQEICIAGSNTSPDCVYSYTPAADMYMDVDLCGTNFSATLFVVEDTYIPGEFYTCNKGYYAGDPNCANGTPRLLELPLYAGHTYYFILDGYLNSFGPYFIHFKEVDLCEISMPEETVAEGEPPLENSQVDNYNSGCNAEPPLRQPINYFNDDTGCVDIAGLTGYARHFGYYFRDTDWFIVTALGDEMSASVISETDFSLFVGGVDCPFWSDYREDMPPCEPRTISWSTVPGQEYTVLVAPRGLSYWNNELTIMDYQLEVCGQDGVVEVRSSTWGALKANYR